MIEGVNMEKDGARYRIEALAKGLAVLSLFDENIVSLKLRDICEATGIPMPTAFRVVATLEQGGYLDRTPDGAYQPGVAVLTLGSAAIRGSSLVNASEKPLRELAEATGETVNLGVLLDDQVLYLARLRNSDLVTANVQVGSTLPAIYTSMGKLLLSALSEEELRSRISDEDFGQAAGPNAVRSWSDLRERLEDIRALGYAIQDQELAAGLRSVSVAVTGASGRTIAAVNVAVSSSRRSADELRGELLDRLRVAASDITRRLVAT